MNIKIWTTHYNTNNADEDKAFIIFWHYSKCFIYIKFFTLLVCANIIQRQLASNFFQDDEFLH